MARKRAALAAAEHRPALRPSRFRHDVPTALDLFSGFGGFTAGIKLAGFEVILGANHNRYKTEVHEANNPEVEHWIADLVDTESSDYHDVRDLPYADLVTAGVSCVNHSPANSLKAYEQGLSLFDLDDPDFDARVTRSERDRATANCVLHYAQRHHPLVIIVECTTQLASWGTALPNRPKVGDGSTYRWWLKQFDKEGYNHKVLYLNSMFFGVGQSRNRGFWVFWDKRLPTPDLEHRPIAMCNSCDEAVEAVWSWKTGVPVTGAVSYGQQYEYRCPRCRKPVFPAATPSIEVLDLSDLGRRIGDMPLKKIKDRKTGEIYHATHARATLARAERCRQRFAEFPAVLMPAKSIRGSERHPWQPMSTQTSQQETAILSTGVSSTGMITPPVAMAIDNYQGAPRGVDEPLPTQGASETMALVSSGIIPFRRNTVPTTHAEAMPTVTADQIPGLLTAAGVIKNNGSIEEAKYRAHPVSDPLGTVVGSATTQSLLFSGWFKQNGRSGTETAPHPASDSLGTLTSRDTTALLHAEWTARLSDLALEDCYFRMMRAYEIGRGCGFDPDHGEHKGTFTVWGSESDQVDGYGNAVSPQIGLWIGDRVRPIIHKKEALV